MNVKMKYRLPAVGVCIDHNAITVLRKTLLPGDLCGSQKQVSERLFIIRPRLLKRINMLARDDQDMCRSLWTEIVERDTCLILKYARRRDLARRYSAENTVVQLHVSPEYEKQPAICNWQLPICTAGTETGDPRSLLPLLLTFSFLLLVFSFLIRKIVRDPLDVGTDRTELSYDSFVTAINVIDAVDKCLAACAKGSENKRCRRAQV